MSSLTDQLARLDATHWKWFDTERHKLGDGLHAVVMTCAGLGCLNAFGAAIWLTLFSGMGGFPIYTVPAVIAAWTGVSASGLAFHALWSSLTFAI